MAGDRWSDVNPPPAFPYVRTGAYALLDVGATYTVTARLRVVSLGLKKPADENYRTGLGLPAAGPHVLCEDASSGSSKARACGPAGMSIVQGIERASFSGACRRPGSRRARRRGHGWAEAQSKPSIILATTTSTQDSGLLDVLVPRFERERGIDVKVIAVGTGAALRMAASGNADVVLVHAPDAERPLVDAATSSRADW